MQLEISDKDIAYAEGILLKKGQTFDDERITFIKNLETIDLQAVPGSGKTTALLAKLLALEKYLPLKDGSGILVISHTNAAVNQIKHKIEKYCPKLFAYPNFVGTIQPFVDQFLAIPFAHNFLGVRLKWIDAELYQESIWNKFQSIRWSEDFDKPGSLFWGRHFEKCLKIAKGDKDKAGDLCNQRIEKEVKDIFLDFLDDTLKTFSDKKVLIKDQNNKKYQAMKAIIKEVIDKEIISYEYAYNMANALIKRAPIIKRLIQNRFKFVFVDEMQDMERYQYDLLDTLFHCDKVVFQRIGDKNQAIFSGKISLEEIWVDRKKRLSIEGSPRLSPKVANVVNNFAIDTTFKIEGRGEPKLTPCMIVFSEDSIQHVLPKFTELINKRISKDVVSGSEYPVKLIGWRKETEDGNLGIKSFYPDYESKRSVTRTVHLSLKSHLVLWATPPDKKYLLSAARKSILEAFIAILRKEEIAQTNGKYYSINSLLKHLRESHGDFYEGFKLNLFRWSKDLYGGKVEEALESIKGFLPDLLAIFKKTIDKASEFINSDYPTKAQKSTETSASGKDNTYQCPSTGLEVEVGTVHSAKGETHLATLYVETFYNKKHESERLSCCFCGKNKAFEGDHDRESARIAYVAMSRPTHLLCFAIHKSRFDAIRDDISDWDIELL